MRVNGGTDLQAYQMSGGVAGAGGTTTSAPTATGLTDTGAAWTASAFIGKLVAIGGVYGVIVANTTNTLTVDRWYTPSTPGGAAASTPGTGSYTILPGCAPAPFMALTTNATAPAATDTALATELATGGSGLIRKLATAAHTVGTSTYTMTATYTATATDQGTGAQTVAKMGMFNSLVAATGIMQFETLLSSTATVTATGDVLTVTQTVTE